MCVCACACVCVRFAPVSSLFRYCKRRCECVPCCSDSEIIAFPRLYCRHVSSRVWYFPCDLLFLFFFFRNHVVSLRASQPARVVSVVVMWS